MPMKRPDAVFVVTVMPVFDVYGCEKKRAQEARGLFGCHLYKSCPNCRVIQRGWEMWGQNGHMQASASTVERRNHWIAIKVLEQWTTQHSGTMGYQFRVGSPIYYVGR